MDVAERCRFSCWFNVAHCFSALFFLFLVLVLVCVVWFEGFVVPEAESVAEVVRRSVSRKEG